MPQSAPVVVLEDFCVEKGGSGKVEKEETEEKEEKEAGYFATAHVCEKREKQQIATHKN